MDLFHYDAESGVPAHVQLREQVKVALALGRLRPGDLLPSIRKVEEELGVGRMIVRKAYQQLQTAGLLRLEHGKGAVLIGNSGYSDGTAKRAEAMLERFLGDLRRERLEPVSFSRYFHQRVVARDHATPAIVYVDSTEIVAWEIGEQVQQALGARVRPLSVEQLKAQRRSLAPEAHVLVSYYYLEDVRKALRGRGHEIFPVSWDYASSLIDRLRALPVASRVLFLIYGERPGHEATRLAVEELVARVQDRKLRTEVRAIEQVTRPESLARSPHQVVLVSNQLWARHQALFERYPQKFWRLAVRPDQPSLQALIEKLGVVL